MEQQPDQSGVLGSRMVLESMSKGQASDLISVLKLILLQHDGQLDIPKLYVQ